MQNEIRFITIEVGKENTLKKNISSAQAWVACEGEAKYGHPRIFLDLSKKNEVICPYCSCHYIVKD